MITLVLDCRRLASNSLELRFLPATKHAIRFEARSCVVKIAELLPENFETPSRVAKVSVNLANDRAVSWPLPLNATGS